jgi:hypothetical protein
MQLDDLAQSYFQKMGQMKMLYGDRALDQQLADSNDRGSREALFLAAQHYALAVNHLRQCLEQVGKTEPIVRQLASRFRRCKPEDIRYLQGEALPTIGQTFNLDTSILDEALSCALEARY